MERRGHSLVQILPIAAKELLEGKNFANLATLMGDGSPQVTMVWVDHEGDFVLINTSIGRVKEKNVRRDSRVALCVIDAANPYHTVNIRGKVVAMIRDGAKKHIDKLSVKYTGRKYSPDPERVILRIEPISIVVH